jgi:subtilase family serine protease
MTHKKEAVHPGAGLRRGQTIWLYLVAVTLIAGVTLPASAAGKYIAHNTPPYVFTAKNLGTENAAETIEVSIWLNPHNRAELDALAKRLYDRTSLEYRHFLTRSQFAAQFAPTAEEAKEIQRFFEAHNLSVVRVGPNNFFVRARGTVGDVEKAFHVVLNKYEVGGKTIRANDRDPYVDGEAASLVAAVSGLDSGAYEHPRMMAQSAKLSENKVGVANAMVANATASNAAPDFYSNICFDGPVTQTFTSSGSLPIGTYKGNHLNYFSSTSSGCGYTPPMIQTAYNLTGLYAEGFNGAGQTIGIIDWCGSLTIQNDANIFSARYGLPKLTSKNFAITYIPTVSYCQTIGQDPQINVEVEWSHAIAPGANINLIISPTSTYQDVNEAEFTAINYGLATVLEGDYGEPEAWLPATEIATLNLMSEIAATAGISTNFPTGDQGDFSLSYLPASVMAPADSPWATAVGGITLALHPDNTIAWQAGFGINGTVLSFQGVVQDPPKLQGLVAGSGGGQSNCITQDSSGNCLGGFPKPSYQKGLPGKYRQLPDISWLADPYTGAVIAITVPNQEPSLVWQEWGGTELACPMFSALWAIANQEAGAPLGQAAPYLYSLPAGAVYDIVPVSSKANVTGSIQDSNGTTKYTAKELVGGPESLAPTKFISVIYNSTRDQDTALVFLFGADCSVVPGGDWYGAPCNTSTSLHTNVGWDNVTGVGTPNAKAFADAFHP